MKVKVYLFLYKGEIRAFTIDKDIADRCSDERPHYKMKVKKMSEHQFSTFQAIYGHYLLFENVIDDGNNTFYPVTTYYENDKLDQTLIEMTRQIEDILIHLKEYNLKKKYFKVMEESLLKYSDDGKLNLNVLRVYLKYISDY